MRRRSLALLLLALPAAGEGDEERIAREVADAHARGDRGRLLVLAAEPPLRVRYARVVDGLLILGHADAAEALANGRQGPEAEGLQRLVRSFRAGLFPTADEREALRQAASRLGEAPESALTLLDALRPRDDTLFAADVSWARARALEGLDRKDDARAEFERCSLRARAVGEWAMARDADEARLRRAATGPQALAAAEALLEAAKRLDDRPAIVRALRARGRVRAVGGELLRRGGNLDGARLRWREAREDYLAASDIAEKDGDARSMGLCWRDIGAILRELEGQPAQALKACERALEALRKGGTPEDVDATLLQAALALTELARYGDALADLDEILAPGRTGALRATALAQRAYVLGRAARLRSALAAYGEALEAAQEPADRVRLLVQTGDLHLARQDPRAAARCYEEALGIAPGDIGALEGKARALGLGGDDEGAGGAYAAALARLEGNEDRARRGVVLALLSEHLLASGKTEEAYRAVLEEVKIFTDESLREFGNAGSAWKALSDLTILLKGDHEAAAKHLANASTIFYRLNQPLRAIELYAQETLLLVMLGRTRDAMERLQVLQNMAETTPNDALKSVAKSAEAIFEARNGKGARALELLDEAQRLAAAAGDRAREATALVDRALLEPDAAARHVRRAIALLGEERLSGPAVRPLIEGYGADWGPGIALDGILKSGKEQAEDAFALLERALADRLLLALRGRDAVLVAALPDEQHGLYVAARADLIEARATGKGVAEAEAAFDAMVRRLRAEAPAIADLAWPPEPPLALVQGALRDDEALVMTLFDPYVKCALVVDKGRAVLRRVEEPGKVLDGLADLLQGKRTLLVAWGGPVEACATSARYRVCHVPTAATFLRQRTAARARGDGVAALGDAPARFGPPLDRCPDRRLAMLYVDGSGLVPLRLLGRRFDADTVVVAAPPGSALATAAAAILAAGAGNVVVAGRPPGPLDIFLDGCLERRLPVGAAFQEASAKGALFLYGAPE